MFCECVRAADCVCVLVSWSNLAIADIFVLIFFFSFSFRKNMFSRDNDCHFRIGLWSDFGVAQNSLRDEPFIANIISTSLWRPKKAKKK